jgi:site-specific DNA-methyltransferase (adenine-specific)
MTLELNKNYCMDCLDGMKDIKPHSVDLIVTDPPYYIEKLHGADMTKSLRRQDIISINSTFEAAWDQQWRSLSEYKAFMDRFLMLCKLVLRPNGQVYMFMSFTHIEWLIAMIKEHDFFFYRQLIWYKPDVMALFPNQYGCSYESILWFRAPVDVSNPKTPVTNNIGCSQRDVFTQTSTLNSYRKECGFHPTPKPINIIRMLIQNSSNPNDIVLDPFMGSGTTAVAAKNTGRRYIGFEKEPKYIEICDKRLAQDNLTNWWA